MPRKACYVNESFAEEIGGALIYHQALITEGEPGYVPGYKHSDLSVLRDMCESVNAAAGLTPNDVAAIVMSSMSCGSNTV